ncbi:MAG: long-chain fatty acid--CoA ligase [Solirubrobacterales bacterium]|nr:long-chain fatty acid--CoA ligase [Solirubrobacterales bacterium]
MPTIPGIVATAAHRTPDAEALVDGDLRLTYAQFDARINQYADVLQAQGVAHGDRVLLMSGNSSGFILAYFAALRVGAIVVPVGPASAPPELMHLAQDSGATTLLLDDACAARVDRDAVAPQLRIVLALSELADLADGATAQAPAVTVRETDDALILYTSGTTGRPKGVLLDHHRVIWVGVNAMLLVGQRQEWRVLHCAPLYHAAQLTMMLTTGSMLSAAHVVVPGFEPGATLDVLERERITLFFGVPTMYQMMLRHPGFATRDLSALRVGVFGAAPMPGHIVRELTSALPDVELLQACGQTEGGPGGIYASFADVCARPDASGRLPLPNLEARVVDEADEHVGFGEVGELVLRGETIMKGYWNRPAETAEALRDGWLRTGDMARYDEGGHVTLVDRKKDMIITGGRNVYSVEVEQAVASHPAVADCAVVGVPHEDYGESILAVVAAAPGATPDLESLRAHCLEHISRYKAPHQLLLVDTIPRNASGKVLKHVLREQVARDALVPG